MSRVRDNLMDKFARDGVSGENDSIIRIPWSGPQRKSDVSLGISKGDSFDETAGEDVLTDDIVVFGGFFGTINGRYRR
jgi:hypothetical protein